MNCSKLLQFVNRSVFDALQIGTINNNAYFVSNFDTFKVLL